MAIMRLALRNLTRRGWYFRISSLVLLVSVLSLLASLGALRSVEERISFVDEMGLRKIFRLQAWYGNSEINEHLIQVLSQQEGIVGVAEIGAASIDTISREERLLSSDPLNAPFYRLRSINRDAASLLAPKMLQGVWLSEIDWDSMDDEVPIVVTPSVGNVGDVISGFFDDSPVKARIVGIFDPNSDYLKTASDVLSRVDHDGFIPAPLVPETTLTRVAAKWQYFIAASPQVLEVNKERWSELLDEERERLGVAYEVRIITMDEWVTNYLQKNRSILVFLLWVAGIAITLTAFGYGSINFVSIWDRSIEFGTHFATGATRRQVAKLVLLEMLLPLLIPVIVALVAWRWGNVWEVIVVDGIVVVQSLAVIGGIGVLSTLGPLLMVQRVKPATLIRGGYR